VYTLLGATKDLAYPIINDLSKVDLFDSDGNNRSEHSVVGVIVASLYWRNLISNILPDGSKGIQIVFENPCTSWFTYQINGPSVVYLGVGDHHDTKYDDLSIDSLLIDLGEFSVRESSYTGAPIDKDYCPFTLHLYPSDLLMSAYKTNNPILFTVSGILIFIFTAMVFHLYDFMVEKRQRSVLETAVQSSAITSSLFPSAVRTRLYPAAARAMPKRTIDSFHLSNEKKSELGQSTNIEIEGSPIANLYPDTTVMFADLAGFTSWSASRQPTQVFTLLETLYAAFDEIAKQRGVFKVETIGDCYVAVGLPTPRKGHAAVMARFAFDCRAKIRELTLMLEETLGPVGTSTKDADYHSLRGFFSLTLRLGFCREPLILLCALG
jgi:Adenylate and Guanylate cyclase catalytic domain